MTNILFLPGKEGGQEPENIRAELPYFPYWAGFLCITKFISTQNQTQAINIPLTMAINLWQKSIEKDLVSKLELALIILFCLSAALRGFSHTRSGSIPDDTQLKIRPGD